MSPSATALAERPKIWHPLRLREYRLLLTGFIFGQGVMPLQFVTAIFWIQSFADGGVVVILVGAIGTIRGLGMLGFGLFGGALADRFDRRTLLMVTQAVAVVSNLGVAAVMWLGMTDIGGIALFFALTMLASAAHGVDAPTRQAMAPEILGPRLTPTGIALQQACMQLAMPVAILATGPMIHYLGHGNVYAISAGGHVAEIVILAMMSYRTVFSAQRLASRGSGAGAAFRDIADGIRFSRSKPVIFWSIGLVALMMVLVMPPTGTLGPTWVTTVVGASDIGFSIIAFFWGFGAMLTSIIVAAFSWYERKGILTASGAMLMAGGFVVFTIQPTALNAIMGNFLLGAGMSMAMIAVVAIIAHETPNDMRGRVMSIFMMGMGLSQAMGLPLGGLAQALTMEVLFPPMALGTFAIIALVIVVRPVIIRARVPADAHMEPPTPPVRPLFISGIAREAPNKELIA